MKCLKCGAELPDDVLFCTACGAKVTETVKPVCTQCGREYPIGTRFCGYCGIKLPFPEGEEPFVPGFGPETPAPGPAPAPAPGPMGPDAGPAPDNKPAGGPPPEEPGTVKELLKSFWHRMDTFRKFAFIAFCIIVVLFAVSLFMRNPWAIAVSVLQIVGLVFALLIHRNLLHKLKRWLKYLFLVLCFLLIALNIFCYFIGSLKSTDAAVPTTAPAEATEEVLPEASDAAAEAEEAEEPEAGTDAEAAPEAAEASEAPAETAAPAATAAVTQTKSVTVPGSADSYIGVNYKTVRKALTKAGFTTITTGVVYDITDKNADDLSEGDVAYVSIDGSREFEEGDTFSAKAPVIITYHSSASNDPGTAAKT